MLLAMPFILVDMPPRAKAGGLVMVIVFTAFFGAAVGHVRLREDRFLERLSMLPISRVSLIVDLLLASVVARGGQAAAILVVFVFINSSVMRFDILILLAGLLCGTLVLLTLFGMGIARLARNNAEVHLFGALAVGILASVSGAIPVPDRMVSLTKAFSWNPINRFVVVLTGISTGSLEISLMEVVSASLVLSLVAAAVIIRLVPRSRISREAFDRSDEIVHNSSAPIKEERR